MKTAIDINEVRALQARRAEINRLNLADVEFVEDGKVLPVPAEWIEEHRFSGLNNMDFVEFFLEKGSQSITTEHFDGGKLIVHENNDAILRPEPSAPGLRPWNLTDADREVIRNAKGISSQGEPLPEEHPLLFLNRRMVLCPTCGNKRCPHANDARFVCTASNEVGQVGVLR